MQHSSPIFIDGTTSTSHFLKDESSNDLSPLVCFDNRRARSLGLIPNGKFFYDLKVLLDHQGDLSDLCKKKNVGCADLVSLQKRLKAFLTAAQGAQLSDFEDKIDEVVPLSFQVELLSCRLEKMRALFSLTTHDELAQYEDFFESILNASLVESSGIAIRRDFVEQCVKNCSGEPHERVFMKHMLLCTPANEWLATTKINPRGTRTWRMSTEGGLKCMQIPHGICRQAIASRWLGGKIMTVDFNAADYRCIISAVDDPAMNSVYAGSRDFHSTTCLHLGEDVEKMRDVVKKVTYSVMYGSSFESLVRSARIPVDQLRRLFDRMNVLFAPVSAFRERLFAQAKSDGFVATPLGLKTRLEPGDHTGQVLGLFGQTFSSQKLFQAIDISLKTLAHGQRKSKLIFTVHDELVFDVHPAELDLQDELPREIEDSTKFVVKKKIGENYDEAT